MEKIEKRFCLTDREYLILMKLIGVRSYKGIPLDIDQNIDEKAVLRELFEMSKKGIVQTEENGFRVCDELREMMENIKKATCIWNICAPEGNKPIKTLYKGKMTTVTEKNIWDRQHIVVYQGSYKDILHEIEEENYYPHSKLNFEEYRRESNYQRKTIYRTEPSIWKSEPILLMGTEQDKEEYGDSVEQIRKNKKLGLIIDGYGGKNMEKHRYILVEKRALEDWLIVRGGGVVIGYPYHEKILEYYLDMFSKNSKPDPGDE
ncbi:MAG: hypothetical protein EOM18_11190 [Clostridia bacterium]|nr:hypothetical protein [Clostridia bacterium]